MSWLRRPRLPRGMALVLAIAWIYGQAKLEATIALTEAGLPALALRACVYGLAVVLTLACYYTTEAAKRRWG